MQEYENVRQTSNYGNGLMGWQRVGETERQGDRETERQGDRETERQGDRGLMFG